VSPPGAQGLMAGIRENARHNRRGKIISSSKSGCGDLGSWVKRGREAEQCKGPIEGGYANKKGKRGGESREQNGRAHAARQLNLLVSAKKKGGSMTSMEIAS